MKDLILIGGGGHCTSCIDVVEQEGKYKIIGIIDVKDKIGTKNLGYEVIGCDEDLEKISKTCKNFLLTVGQIQSSALRRKLYSLAKNFEVQFPTIISPLSTISRHVNFGIGNIFMHHALVNANVEIGSFNIFNSKSLIEHDCKVGDFNHLSTGAIMNGGCKVGDDTFIGSQAVLRDQLTIPNNTIIQAGKFFNYSDL